jgi:hypothetical protein
MTRGLALDDGEDEADGEGYSGYADDSPGYTDDRDHATVHVTVVLPRRSSGKRTALHMKWPCHYTASAMYSKLLMSEWLGSLVPASSVSAFVERFEAGTRVTACERASARRHQPPSSSL